MTTVEQTPLDSVELSITGMTCSSCANRIERKLNKLEGVTATVNYATEKAKVSYPTDLPPAALLEAVEKAGYTAALPWWTSRRRRARPVPTPSSCCGAGCCSSPS